MCQGNKHGGGTGSKQIFQLTGFKLIVTSDVFLTVYVDEYAKSPPSRCTGCVVIADHLATGHWPLDTSH